MAKKAAMTLSLIDGVAQCFFSLRMYAWVISAICRVLTFLLILSLGSYAAFIMGPLLAAVENLSKDPSDPSIMRDFLIAAAARDEAQWDIEKGDVITLDWQGAATNAMHVTVVVASSSSSSSLIPLAVSQALAASCNHSRLLRAVSTGWLATCFTAQGSCTVVAISSSTTEITFQVTSPDSIADSLCADRLDWSQTLEFVAPQHKSSTVFAPVTVVQPTQAMSCAGVLNVTLVVDELLTAQDLSLNIIAIPSLPARSVAIVFAMPPTASEMQMAIAVDLGTGSMTLSTLDLFSLNATYITGIAVGSNVRLIGLGSSSVPGVVTLLLWEHFAVGTSTIGGTFLPQYFAHSVRLADGVISDAVLLPSVDSSGERWVLLNASAVNGLIDATCVAFTPAGQLVVASACNTHFGASFYNLSWTGGIRVIGIASTGKLPDGAVTVVVAGAAYVSASYGMLLAGASYHIGPASQTLVSAAAAPFQQLGYGVRRVGVAIGPHTLLLSQ